ncbi:MAG: AbrB/MazE/SpoVT family DNA-binding domain-containing protein [Clostridia bacterium]|nr:AbrB/MazE/SpoVT family DNA-binding domain-containing protein [Clostridia bacterium]
MAEKAHQNGDKYLFGTVRVGEKGQIVIPKQCREVFDIKPGDTLLILGDKAQGIGIVKQEKMIEFARAIFAAPNTEAEDDEQ